MNKVILGDILNFKRGYDLTKTDMKNGNIPVVGSNGIIGYHNKVTSKAPCVTIGRSGTVGKPNFYDYDCWAHNTCLYIDDFKGNDPRYIYYLLKTLSLDKLSISTGVPTLNRNYVHPLKVIASNDIQVQKKIVAVLGCIDKKIQNNNNIIIELENMLKTIYDYWFTQFDFPDENGKPYKSSGGSMIYNKELKREIPVGWESQTMVENNLFKILKPEVDIFERKEYLATGEVNGTLISKGNIVEYETRESRANMQPKVNTVWFAKMKNSIKHLFLNKEMQEFIDTTILSTGFYGLQCNEDSFEFVSSFISNSYFETRKNMLAHGATQEAVNNADLEFIFIAVPSIKILKNYHTTVKNMFAKNSKLIMENQQLIDLKEWLLPMLINGQAIVI